MNRLQHLLIKLAEESSEIAQIALKTSQFGPDSKYPGQPLNNFQLCHKEIDDLLGVIEMLNERFSFGYEPNRENIETRKRKVDYFLSCSIEIGLVDGDTPHEKP